MSKKKRKKIPEGKVKQEIVASKPQKDTQEIVTSKSQKVKQEIERLKAEKVKLQTELNQLNLIVLGKENAENAKEISRLEEKKTLLSQQLKTVNSEAKSLYSQIDKLKTQISEIGNNELVEKLFTTIRDKRWFFFENRKMFLFDKWSGMLWANLNNFTLTSNFNYQTAPAEIEKINWHNLKDWRLPSRAEFWFMINDFR